MKVLFSHYFRKMLLVLLIVGLLPVMVLGIVFMHVYESSLQRMTVENAEIQASQISMNIDQFIDKCAQLNQTVANQMEVKSVLSYLPGKVEIATLEQVLELLTVNRHEKMAVHIVGRSHTFSSTQIPEHYGYSAFAQSELFATLDGMPRSSVFFSKPYTDKQGRRIVLSVIAPVSDYHNKFVGYTIVDIYQFSFISLLGQLGGSLDMALWYDGTLLLDTSSSGLPSAEEMKLLLVNDDRMQENGWIIQSSKCITWKHGQHNRLERVFAHDISPMKVAKQLSVKLLVLLIGLTTVMVVVFVVVLSVHQSRPIIRLHHAMDEAGKGNLKVQYEVTGKDEIADLGRRFNLLVSQLDEDTQERILREKELRKQEISALQSQINPHFIYNTLGAVRSLIHMNLPEKASLTIQHLSLLLHANFQTSNKMITLREDAELINSYMIIQNIRFNNRFTLHLDIPAELEDCMLPSLILQPIVENAVKHDLVPKQGKGSLWVSARREQDDVILIIENDGVGIALKEQDELNAQNPIMDHIGYLNVRRRIELYYGAGYTTHIEALSKGTRVTLRIKYAKEERNVSSLNC